MEEDGLPGLDQLAAELSHLEAELGQVAALPSSLTMYLGRWAQWRWWWAMVTSAQPAC